MRRRIEQAVDGGYILIEDSDSVVVTISGATPVAEIADEKEWIALTRNAANHDKLKEMAENIKAKKPRKE